MACSWYHPSYRFISVLSLQLSVLSCLLQCFGGFSLCLPCGATSPYRICLLLYYKIVYMSEFYVSITSPSFISLHLSANVFYYNV